MDTETGVDLALEKDLFQDAPNAQLNLEDMNDQAGPIRATVRLGKRDSKIFCNVSNVCKHPSHRFLVGIMEHDIHYGGVHIRAGDQITFSDSQVEMFFK